MSALIPAAIAAYHHPPFTLSPFGWALDKAKVPRKSWGSTEDLRGGAAAGGGSGAGGDAAADLRDVVAGDRNN
ncbi:hypothetical protein HDV00_008398 [Rhizophlyctis rosea]|nr:hypothetical protein HDV00_008398 [Rhizophlyctis rosea]